VIKGYIHKNGEGRWELGFLSALDQEGEALYTTYNTYALWSGAFEALVRYQIRGQ
jgi:hypothetical protein